MLGLLACLSILAGRAPAALAATRPVAAPPPGYGTIELIRDTWGIPHVFSTTDAGALYGLGYATGEERAFQMHYQLRIIQGRLAEVVGERPSARRGETAVDNDRKMRTFGFYRAAASVAAKLDADTLSLLNAYCEGVNAYVASHRQELHPLFTQLGLNPEPWTPADCIASWWHLGQFFATDGTRELLHYRNLMQPADRSVPAPGRGGGRLLAAPKPSRAWFDDEVAVVLRSDVADPWLERVQAFLRAHGLESSAPPGAGAEGPKFSHAWVVGGKKSTTGAAVLVSDPQTPIRNPSLWQEFHICGKSFNARGIGVPGSPALLIGWNEHLAWGATALGADQADLFRLKTDPAHTNQYLLDGQWRDLEIVRETIRVKNGTPIEITTRQTRFGPIVTPFAFAAPGDPEVALKRVPLCQTDRETIQAAFGMMRAADLTGFTRALTNWQFPSLNLVFGDRRGNIGYWLLAAIPIRSPRDGNQGSAAVDGTRSDCDWQGYVPHELLPHVINPARGWVASANHRAIGSFYPAALGLSTGSGGHTVRSWRLYERLGARERFQPAEVLDIHFDTVNPARRDIVRAGLHVREVQKGELSPEAGQALKHLEGWFARGAKSDLSVPGGELAGEINTFFRLLSTPLAGRFGGGESGLTRFLRDLEARLIANPKTSLDRDEQDFIDQALTGAWASAQQRYGSDPAQWNEKARLQILQRRLGWFDGLDGFGSLESAGDLLTPALTCVDGGTLKSQAAQSYTQYVPLHEVDSAMSLLPPGHSEWMDNSARTNTAKLWAQGQLHPAPLSRQRVNGIAASTVRLSK